MPSSTGRPGMYSNPTPSKRMWPPPAGSSPAPGRSVTSGELSVGGGDHARADEQHCRLSDERHPRDQGDVEGALPVRLDRLVEDRLGTGPELLALARLLCERLDDVDADDVLLGDGGDVGELLLDLAQSRVRDVAVAVCEDDQYRRDRERDQSQLPLEEEQHPGDEDDREDVLEEEDQAVAEEEAHALEVDGRPRHQLAGLVAVVEAEREPDEACIEALAQVHLDRERLPARDQPAAEHQNCANDPQRDDGADVHPQLVRVARSERVVDHVLRYPDEGDLTALVADREDGRNRQRGLVGPEKSEQSEEGLAVARCLGHSWNLAVRESVAALS